MEEEIFDAVKIEADDFVSAEVERINAAATQDAQSLHQANSRAGTSSSRESVLRTTKRGHPGPYDPDFSPAKRSRIFNNHAPDRALGTLENSSRDIAEPSRMHMTTRSGGEMLRLEPPEPQFNELVTDWVPGKRNIVKSDLAATYKRAVYQTLKNKGHGAADLIPYGPLYNPSWNFDVKILLKRRAYFLNYGILNNIDQTDLLNINREQIIRYFRGDTRRADSLLNWWEQL